MIDIKLIRDNPEIVRQNMKKKFQDHKLSLVDEVLDLDVKNRKIKLENDELRMKRNSLSSQIGSLMMSGKKEEANSIKEEVSKINDTLKINEDLEVKYAEQIKEKMMRIPNIIDSTVPIGKNDTQNVEVQKYGDPVIPKYEIPYHADIMEKLNGIDLDSARRVSGNGFYYLTGDIARLHSAVLTYARDFMIDKGFTYCIPPFMVRSDVVTRCYEF